MRATLYLKNVGGLMEGKYVFYSNKLNIIVSANSSGKTSIVKGLAAVLSVPKNGVYSESIFGEALKLGIKTDPHNPFEGFVNIHADEAIVELEFNGSKHKYVVKQSGEILDTPENSDERFLLAGVLSNNSRVLRQLRGLDNREPDDFRWAVEELSFAQKYSSIAEILKTWKEDFIEKKELIKTSRQELQPLLKKQSSLEMQLRDLDLEIKTLTEKLAGVRVEIENLVKDRDNALKEINRLKDVIQKLEIEKTRRTKIEIDPKLRQLEEEQKRRKEIESKLADTRKEIASLLKMESRKAEIERKVNQLIDQRNLLDGMLNLYLMAEANIREKKNGKLPCPLCRTGSITYKEIMQNIDDYRKKRETINAEILKLNQEKQTLVVQLAKAQETERSLYSSLLELEDKIKFIKRQLAGPLDEIRQIDSVIDDYRKKLEHNQKIFDALSSEISKRADVAVSQEFDQKNQLRSKIYEELGKIRQKISELSVIEILGLTWELEVAESICKDMLDILNDRIAYLENRAAEEREQAAKKFNENITLLMSSLNFQEFRTIRITGSPNYRLYVERYDPEKKDYKSQDVGTLSTSEKLAISIILQVALKETYLKNSPFLIIDDVLEDFDSERRDKVIDYLKEKIKKENWFIIATKLVKEPGPPKVEYL